MHIDQAAWAAAVGAAATTVAAGWFTYLAGSKGIKSTEHIAKLQRDHDMQMREADRQTQLQAAKLQSQYEARRQTYVLIRTECRYFLHAASEARAAAISNREPVFETLPPVSAQDLSLTDLMVSEHARDGYLKWDQAAKSFGNAFDELKESRTNQTYGQIHQSNAWDDFLKAYTVLVAASDELLELLRSDLEPSEPERHPRTD